MSHITDLEDYYASMQRLEFSLMKDDTPMDKIVAKNAINQSLYTEAAAIGELESELTDYLTSLTTTAGNRGKLMATKAMKRFLETSERRDMTLKQLKAVEKLNHRQVERRILLYETKIGKEANYLKSEIKEFMINAKMSGRTRKDALKELIRAGGDDTGLINGFRKKVKRVAIDAARREASSRQIEEYRKVAKPGEKWQWITVSTSPCPDCQARAGVVLSYDRWVEMGLPGTGRTVCDTKCRCILGPVSVTEELFPDVKEFKWDKEKLVLTTAGEARALKAKSNQPPQK